MDKFILLMANFGFAIFYLILSGAAMLLYMPKHLMLKNYRISRYIMGVNYLFMAAYCFLRMFFIKTITIYDGLWIISLASLVFSWMNYTSFMFAVSSSKKITRSMLADGAFPLAIMLCLGYVGHIEEKHRNLIAFILVIIYLIKVVWMFIQCLKQWNRCNREVNDEQKSIVDMRWMRRVLWGMFIVSLTSLLSYFMDVMYVFYVPFVLFLFTYLTFKMINFMPKKIEELRNSEMAEEEKVKAEKKPVELIEKLESKIELWIAEKKFCRPELTIKKVAEEIGTNHNYLSAHLNRNLGVNFQTWLNTLRVEEGKHLLLSEPRMSIEEIAAKVGFNQNYNFSKWFKQLTGLTPFQFRKQNLVR